MHLPRGYAIHGVLPANYAILLHTPEFLRHYRPLGNHLLVDGVLAPRDRELAILRVGWLSKVPYVWGEHVTIGKKCGLTSADIERVIEGPPRRAGPIMSARSWRRWRSCSPTR